jgi:hypothetical protein
MAVAPFKTTNLGFSTENRPIEVFSRIDPAARAVLILGGVHGDEPKGVYLVRKLRDWLEREGSGLETASWIVVPVVNPDGFVRRKRRNARGVDINRNFPTRNWSPGSPRRRMYGGPHPASEPETRAVIRAVEVFRPVRILTVHSIGGRRFCNNFDGPARRLARKMHGVNGYPVQDTIGYPTPGSFGTWAGRERRIPTITLELPSTHSANRCWIENRDAMLAFGAAG